MPIKFSTELTRCVRLRLYRQTIDTRSSTAYVEMRFAVVACLALLAGYVLFDLM